MAAPGEASKTPPTILVVDDDPDVRDSVVDALASEGYGVVPAAHGLEALRLLREGGRFDLIVLDMLMPVMDGWAFLEAKGELAEIAAIPVLVISAHGIEKAQSVRLKAAGFLGKPMELVDLLQTVARLTGWPAEDNPSPPSKAA